MTCVQPLIQGQALALSLLFQAIIVDSTLHLQWIFTRLMLSDCHLLLAHWQELQRWRLQQLGRAYLDLQSHPQSHYSNPLQPYCLLELALL